MLDLDSVILAKAVKNKSLWQPMGHRYNSQMKPRQLIDRKPKYNGSRSEK